MCGCFQDVFHERVKVYQNWQHAQMMLNKKREQKAKLELSGKPDRGNTAGVEVVEVKGSVMNSLSFVIVCRSVHHSLGIHFFS